MPAQEDRIVDVEKNLTILLGIASGQERNINSIQLGVISLQRDIKAIEGRLYTLEKGVEEQNNKLDQIMLLLNTLTNTSNQ